MFDRLVELLVASLRLFQFWVVVDPYERGVLLRLGHFNRVLEPGFHWCIPLHVDRVIADNVVPRTERLTGLATTTKDGKAIAFDAVVTYRISDVVKAVLECEHVQDAIADSCAGILGTTLSEASWNDIWHGTVVEQLTTVCRKRGWRWGVEIMSVQLIGATPVKNLRIAWSGAQSRVGTHIAIG